jgi:hypothetical protein
MYKTYFRNAVIFMAAASAFYITAHLFFLYELADVRKDLKEAKEALEDIQYSIDKFESLMVLRGVAPTYFFNSDRGD